MVVVQPSKFW
ncbi:hypothetical protein D047_4787A, partial [Vibrio parahaemolyticus VPTS-2010_2]